MRHKIAAILAALASMLGMVLVGPAPAHADQFNVYQFSVIWHQAPPGWPSHRIILSGTYLTYSATGQPMSLTKVALKCLPTDTWDPNQINVDGTNLSAGNYNPNTADYNWQWSPSGDGNIANCGDSGENDLYPSGVQANPSSNHDYMAIRYTFDAHFAGAQPDAHASFTIWMPWTPGGGGGGGGSASSCTVYLGSGSDGGFVSQNGFDCWGYKIGTA